MGRFLAVGDLNLLSFQKNQGGCIGKGQGYFRFDETVAEPEGNRRPIPDIIRT